MISKEAKKSVLVPLIFFGWFKFPLTWKELRRYVWGRELSEEDLRAIVKEFSRVSRVGDLVWRGDFSSLERSTAKVLASQLWDKVARWRRLFSYIPFLSQVYVTNTLAYDNARADSDIDLLLVGQSGRLWTMRAWLLVLMNLFNLRVRSVDRWGKFSPELFVTLRALDMSKIAIKKDYYLAYWLADLVPIWPDGEHRSLRQANQWVKPYLPLAWRSPKIRQWRYLRPAIFRQVIEKMLTGKLGDCFEAWAYGKQRRIIDRNIRKLGVNSSVLYNRDIIKLHFNDRRAPVRDAIEDGWHDLLEKTK